MAGVQESFGKAARRTLLKWAGLRLCESTVERTTEEAGKRLGTRWAAGAVFGPRTPWAWNRDAMGRTCAYVSLDELGLQMRRQGAQVGRDAADVWIALTDGGNGLEEFIDGNFPRAEKILDFQHGATHLATFAKQFRPETSEKLLAAWRHTLKHAGGAVMIGVLERLDRKKMAKEVREGREGVLNYLRKNVGRMDYPTYLRNGWQIASGAVESAYKTVVNQRLCLGGMRWGKKAPTP